MADSVRSCCSFGRRVRLAALAPAIGVLALAGCDDAGQTAAKQVREARVDVDLVSGGGRLAAARADRQQVFSGVVNDLSAAVSGDGESAAAAAVITASAVAAQGHVTAEELYDASAQLRHDIARLRSQLDLIAEQQAVLAGLRQHDPEPELARLAQRDQDIRDRRTQIQQQLADQRARLRDLESERRMLTEQADALAERAGAIRAEAISMRGTQRSDRFVVARQRQREADALLVRADDLTLVISQVRREIEGVEREIRTQQALAASIDRARARVDEVAEQLAGQSAAIGEDLQRSAAAATESFARVRAALDDRVVPSYERAVSLFERAQSTAQRAQRSQGLGSSARAELAQIAQTLASVHLAAAELMEEVASVADRASRMAGADADAAALQTRATEARAAAGEALERAGDLLSGIRASGVASSQIEAIAARLQAAPGGPSEVAEPGDDPAFDFGETVPGEMNGFDTPPGMPPGAEMTGGIAMPGLGGVELVFGATEIFVELIDGIARSFGVGADDAEPAP